MGTHIYILITNRTIKTWFNNNNLILSQILEIKHFASLKSLHSELLNKEEIALENALILLDIEDELHFDYANSIKILSKNIKLMAIGLPKDINTVKELFKNGYNGFIDITANEIDLIKSIEKIKAGKYYLPDNKVDEIIKSITEENKNKLADTFLDEEKIMNLALTKKDQEVIDFLIKGYTYKNIAEILCLTAFAVNQRAKSIYKKCGVRSRSELSYLLLK